MSERKVRSLGTFANAALLAITLAACNFSSMDPNDRFAPGKWRVEAWMESGGHSTRGSEGEIKPQTVDLTAAQASQPPLAVFATYFYHGIPNDADIRFRGGEVDGTFHQKGVDDISAHDVTISGTYGPDNFRVTFGYRAFGMPFDQTVEGKLIEPAPAQN